LNSITGYSYTDRARPAKFNGQENFQEGIADPSHQ